MIEAIKLSYGFPQKDLYEDISFTLLRGHHCALIGTSGSGKTTLLDIIQYPDKYLFDGKLLVEEGCRMGHTSQFYKHDGCDLTTVFDFIARRHVEAEAVIDGLCAQMETAADLEPLLEQYQAALDVQEAMGGGDYPHQIEKMLYVAGLTHLRDQPMAHLSGGECKLVQLMAEMAVQPDLLLMDEPDVFLDFENLNALRRLINAHKGTLLVVTHSRYLLNHCFNQILHLEHEELRQFDGRYMDYRLTLLDKKIELLELAFKDTQEIARNEALIDRLRQTATDTAETVWGRALKARVKIQERLTARRIEEPFVFIRQPELLLVADPEPEKDDVLLTATDYSVAFQRPLLEGVNLQLMGQEKVALIGPNGTGKTTLLRDLYHREDEVVHKKAGISVGYLSQAQGEVIHDENTVLEEIGDHPFETPEELEQFLETYGFMGAGLRQKVGSLSGGERNLLQLAKLSLQSHDLLLLDEPTSHLDTDTQVALETAIRQYNGGMLMVSHDFYFIANCMDYVLMIENGTLRKMSIRAFRKMIYANHFDKDYLALEQKKLGVELELSLTLQNKDFEGAKALLEKLTELTGKL